MCRKNLSTTYLSISLSLAGLLPLALSDLANAASLTSDTDYAYLNDANVQTDAPAVYGSFPKVMLSETQYLRDLTAEGLTKYDAVGGTPGMMEKIANAQLINPDLKFHYAFFPRAYTGATLTDPCSTGSGMPFNSTGAATENCSVYAGHWLYYEGTQLTASVGNAALTLKVKDASKLEAGEYVVIYDAPAGSFNNAEHVRVGAVNKSTNTITLLNRGYKSKARWHGVNSIVAQHALGRSAHADPDNYVRNWAFNQSSGGPVDGNGHTIGEAMIDWLGDNIRLNSQGEYVDIRVDGIYFDADPYFNLPDADRIDGNNDLVAEGFITANGRNLWGEGMEKFYAEINDRFPGKRIIGGQRITRGFDSLEGTQMEGFPVANYDAAVPDYGHSGGNDGFDSVFQRYMIHLQYHKTTEGYTENLLKTPTQLYSKGISGITSNAPFRLAFASTLMGDGHFGQINSSFAGDTWYDEYAVDVEPGSSTYGHAVKRNALDESAILQAKGWLGRPLGPHQRLYDAATFASDNSLFWNNGFESGDSGWTSKNVDTYVANQGVAGSRSLRIDGHQTYGPKLSDAWVKAPEVNLVEGEEYTLVFAAKADSMRDIRVRVDDTIGNYLVPNRWTRIVHTFKSTKSGLVKPQFNVGQEDIGLWLDAVFLFKGNANVLAREFDNGIVIANATSKWRTIDLGQDFQRIKGTGQDSVNNGVTLSVISIAPYDAAILVRPEAVLAPAPLPEPTPEPEPEPTPEPTPPVTACGEPTYNTTDATTVYVWEDTCTEGLWHLRIRTNVGVENFDGSLSSNGGFSSVQGYKLESTDVVDASTAGEIQFSMEIGTGRVDGFDFFTETAADACLTMMSPGDVQVRLGSSALAVRQQVDIHTGSSCERESYGAPDMDSVSGPAMFLWQNPTNSRWAMEVRGDGSKLSYVYSGEMTRSGTADLIGVDLEVTDLFVKTTGGFIYELTAGSGADGLRWTPNRDHACLEFFTGGAPVYLGKDMIRVTEPLNLTTLGTCNP